MCRGKKFQEWLQENQRSFTTRREQEWLKQRATALVQLGEPAPPRPGRNPAEKPVPRWPAGAPDTGVHRGCKDE